MSEIKSQGTSTTASGASVYQAYQANTHLFGGNAPYVEEMYENYLAHPGSVPDSWRDYFDALQHVPAVDGSDAKDVAHLLWSMPLPSAPGKAARGSCWPAPTPKWDAREPRHSN